MSDAADLSCLFPDNLGEVAPSGEVRVVGLLNTVEWGEQWLFAVVHEVGDHNVDFAGAGLVTHVLAICAALVSTA